VRLLMTSFAIFSLVGCASEQRPNSYACGVNGAKARLECFNIKTDYDDNGVRKPDAQALIVPLPAGLLNLNGAICFLPPKGHDEGIRGLKRWLGDVRDYAKEHCQ
jgi:hypothetical protein